MSMTTATGQTTKGPGKRRAQVPRRAPVLLVLGLLMAAGLYFFYDRPESSALAKAQQALLANQGNYTALLAEEAKIKSHPHLVPDLYKAASAGDALLPPALSSSFFTTLHNDAVGAGLSSVAFSDAAPQSAGNLTYQDYSASVTGTYAQIAYFISSVTASPELVTVAATTLTYVPPATPAPGQGQTGQATAPVVGQGGYQASIAFILWAGPNLPTTTTTAPVQTTTPVQTTQPHVPVTALPAHHTITTAPIRKTTGGTSRTRRGSKPATSTKPSKPQS